VHLFEQSLELLQIIDRERIRLGSVSISVDMSLDGYIEDQNGKFDWAEPDEAVHRFINDLERAAGTYLYGRRMYETIAV
jgi:dihydrofolate reductase